MNGILANILKNRDDCTSRERVVADAILNNPTAVLSRTITEYATYINTAPATITRFCKRMGIAGFQELKLLIVKDHCTESVNIGTINSVDKNRSMDTVEGIIDNVITNAFSSIEQLSRLFDVKKLELAASMILSAKNKMLCGVGASGIVARDFQQKLIRIGFMAHCDDDLDLAKVFATSFDENDLVVAFSYSGQKSEIRNILKIAKSNGAKIISVTKSGDNSIASISDINLVVAPSEAIVREGATVSRLQMLVVVDVLYQILIRRNTNENCETLMETWKNVSGDKESNG